MLSLLIVFSGSCSISIHIKLLVQVNVYACIKYKYLSVSNFLFTSFHGNMLLHLPYVLTRLQFFQEPLDVFVFNTYFIFCQKKNTYFIVFFFFFSLYVFINTMHAHIENAPPDLSHYDWHALPTHSYIAWLVQICVPRNKWT